MVKLINRGYIDPIEEIYVRENLLGVYHVADIYEYTKKNVDIWFG